MGLDELRELASQSVSFSQSVVKSSDSDPATLKEQRANIQKRNDAQNDALIKSFEAAKKDMSAADQIAFWANIHSEARGGSKLYREAAKQIKQVFDKVPPEERTSFARGSIPSVLGHVQHVSSDKNDNSIFAVKRRTQLLVANASLDYLQSNHNEIAQDPKAPRLPEPASAIVIISARTLYNIVIIQKVSWHVYPLIILSRL